MTTEKVLKLQDALDEVRQRYHGLILNEIKTTHTTYREISNKFGCSESLVYMVARLNGITRAGQEKEERGDE